MKKVYCMLLLLTFSLSCHSERPINEKVLPVVEEILGKPTKTDLYEKHLFYIFAVPDTAISKYGVVKNAIDKCLNMLPTKHDTQNDFSMDTYEWETPQYMIIWDLYRKSKDQKFYNRLEIILK